MYIDRRLLIIGAGGVLLVILLTLGGIFLFGRKKDGGTGGKTVTALSSGGEVNQSRQNTLNLARDYISQGEYAR
ncbi:MAG: hypothetical protein LBR96_07725, partial [Treponema sp.]|nr:hypothetical protein [Treponema sp.]